MHGFETTWRFSDPYKWSFFPLQEGDGGGAPALPEMCIQNAFLLRELTNTPEGMETKESKTQDKNPEEVADGKFSALFKYNLNTLVNHRRHCIVITARGHTQC